MSQVIFALVLVAIGVAGLLIVGRRAFYRRNAAGVEEHNGFASMLATRAVEKVIRVISSFCLFAGGVVLLIHLMKS
jgi:hypothetical protein